MEISQYTWSHQKVVLSRRVGSEEKIFLKQSSFGGSVEPSTLMEFLCQSASGRTSHIANQDAQLDIEDVVSYLFESNAAGVMKLSFEGHCTMTNADEANEVQENVVTAKKGKKRGIKGILWCSRY